MRTTGELRSMPDLKQESSEKYVTFMDERIK